MLTLIKTASLYNLSRNPNYVKISTNNYTYPDNIGNKAEGVFANLAPNLLNDTFSIPFLGGTRTYTFKNSANIALLQVTKYVSGPSALFIQNLITELSLDIPLTNLFYLSRFGTSLVLIAKNPGSAYSLTGASTSVAAGSFYDRVVGTDVYVNAIRPNFKIATDLFQETAANSNVYKKVASIPKEPSDNVVEMDLAAYIDNCLEYQFPEFYLPSPPAFLCTQLSKRFYVRNYEVYGNPPVQQGAAFQTANYHSLKAGFGPIMNKVVPQNQFANFYFPLQAFLTRQNRFKKIARHQIEYLYFLFPADIAGTARLKYTLYDKDGNTTVTTFLTTSAGVKYGNVWAFPTNGPAGFLVTDPNLVKMEVQVQESASGTILSETFTYLADDTYYPAENFVYFANTDGGMDTVRLTGSIEEIPEFERETAKRTLTVNDGPYDGDTKSLYNLKTQSVVIFSGWKPKEEMSYYEDLFLSRKAFIYKEFPGRISEMPIIITSRNFVRNKTNQNLYGFVLEYYEARSSELPEISYYPF